MTCDDVDLLMTSFVDDTCEPSARAAVAFHLASCESCRTRAEAEASARDLLQARAAVARSLRVSPRWRPRVWRLGRPALPLRPSVLLAIAALLAGASAAGSVGWWLRPTPIAAVGIIGDSYCHQHHDQFTERFHATDRECTLGCVARGAEFVLVTDTEVYRIRNQSLPELARFANQRVRVEGTVADSVILVRQIVDDAASAGGDVVGGTLRPRASVPFRLEPQPRHP